MLNRTVTLLFLSVVLLWGADFWKEDPFDTWSDEDAYKLLNDSPWSKEVRIIPPGGGIPGGGMPSGGPSGGGGGRGGGGGGRGGGGGGIDGGAGVPISIPIHLVWQTALPVKQAIVMRRMDPEQRESDQVKSFLEETEPYYILRAVGLPRVVEPQLNEQTIQAILEQTKLTTKVNGREIKPAVIQDAGPSEIAVTRPANFKADADGNGKGKGFGRGGFAAGGPTFDLYYLFSRDEVFDVDKDKELKFESHIGDRITLKKSFKLKDMVYNGKLEL